MSIPCVSSAQVVPAVKAATSQDIAAKWDFFAGYSYLRPYGTVSALTWPGNVTLPFSYVPVNGQVIGSVTRYYGRHWGAEFIGDVHLQNDYPYPGQFVPRNSFSGASGGVIYRFKNSSSTPFIHVLAGGEIADGPAYQSDNWGPVGTIGGGLDCETPLLKHHMAIRVIQADYQRVYESFGTGEHGGIGNINAYRLSAGAVFHTGADDANRPVLGLACLATPSPVFPGEPVTLTATVSNLSPRQRATYTWTGAGVGGNGERVTVATASLAPGNYTVTAQVREDKSTRDCLRVIPPQHASCIASFTVKRFEPPAISCVASPGIIKPGETSNITAVGVSPQNRPLTYSYSASGGSVTGSGTVAVFNSAGAPTGSVVIPCVVTDDTGQMATSSTSVTVLPPYVPPIQHSQALCSISFATDKKRPSRVNNEGKACLDEIALDLEKQPDAKFVVVGKSDATEKANSARQQEAALRNKHIKAEDTAAERAVNAKQYLVTEKGIDAARISVATSAANGQTTEDYLVPSGANFTADVHGTSLVDESTVKAQEHKPLPVSPHKKPAVAVTQKPAQSPAE
ncbi:MAG: OmpA family protein [Terracidiphilus sp.]